VGTKRLELLCEVVRQGLNFAFLSSSKDYNPIDFEGYAPNIKAAARSLGRELVVFEAPALNGAASYSVWEDIEA
jgi:hypothetical protein